MAHHNAIDLGTMAKQAEQYTHNTLAAVASRRAFLRMTGTISLLGLSGCLNRQSPDGFGQQTAPSRQLNAPIEPYKLMFAGIHDHGYKIAPVPYRQLKPDFLRQIVPNPTIKRAGTIIVDRKHCYLLLVLSPYNALRYGIAIGPQSTSYKGAGTVTSRETWPVWYPDGADIRRKRSLEIWKKGQPPGVHNVLGARALYVSCDALHAPIVIHGTSQWKQIGKPIETGQFAMLNQDIIDLYQRTKLGAPVLII